MKKDEQAGHAGFEEGIARLPKWIAGLGLAGTGVAGQLHGLPAALGFLLGAAGAWLNLKALDRFVNRLGRSAIADQTRVPQTRGGGLFLQFLGLVTGAFVILKVSGLSLIAALCGFLVLPAAVLLEIVYELLTYGHS